VVIHSLWISLGINRYQIVIKIRVKCLLSVYTGAIVFLLGNGLNKTKGKKMTTFCNCLNYCLNSKCISSDSNLKVAKCWCADCKERRVEIKKNAYAITSEKAGA
jgi:hypothetical protein